jgi:CTD kinase subunit beta
MAPDPVGPHPSYIEVAKPYIFDQKLQKFLSVVNTDVLKENTVRIQGVGWIDNVRRAMQLPVKTFNTAVVYYHKFRLIHNDSDYNLVDLAAAALFTACKIEDTLKKSREILCAAWNLKLAPADQLSADDPHFEGLSKYIIVLERNMLESNSFDFRNRHPQKLVIKLVKARNLSRDPVGRTAYNLCMDLYRTFAPLKQTTPTMAIACVELAVRIHNLDPSVVANGNRGINYKKWTTSRAEVMETMLDLLDLYTNYQHQTKIGSQYTIETFIEIRIALNQESTAANLPRYTEWVDVPKPSPSSSHTNGIHPRNGINSTSPATPATPGAPTSPSQPVPSAIGVRGQSGTVRFMLDAARAQEEKATVEKYHKPEEEEYEEKVPAVETERRRAR